MVIKEEHLIDTTIAETQSPAPGPLQDLESGGGEQACLQIRITATLQDPPSLSCLLTRAIQGKHNPRVQTAIPSPYHYQR